MAAFTTIAAGVGLAATAATTTMSFVQAGKQKKAMRDAERDAQAAMDAARKKLEVNVYAAQGINKEPYRLEREALLSAGAQAIEAGVESERGAAATAGRVQMAQNEAQAGQTAAMSKEMTDLENKKLEEQSRLNDIGIDLDLGEVEGNQAKAANYEQMANQSTEQGWQGVVNFATQAAQAVPLYLKGSTTTNTTGATGNLAIGKPQTQFNIGAAGQGQLSNIVPSTTLASPNFTIGAQQNPNTLGGNINIQGPQFQGVDIPDYMNPFLPYDIIQDPTQKAVANKVKKASVVKKNKGTIKRR